MPEQVRLFRITERTKVGVNDGVYKKSEPENPLLIAPVASGQLRHKEAVSWTLVVHPSERPTHRVDQKVCIASRIEKERQRHEEERSRIAGSAILWIMHQGWNVPVDTLVSC